MIKFTEDVDGIYTAGQVVELDGGTEDAFVNWRKVAEYVSPDQQPEVKAMDAPPKDKMMRAPKAKK